MVLNAIYYATKYFKHSWKTINNSDKENTKEMSVILYVIKFWLVSPWFLRLRQLDYRLVFYIREKLLLVFLKTLKSSYFYPLASNN